LTLGDPAIAQNQGKNRVLNVVCMTRIHPILMGCLMGSTIQRCGARIFSLSWLRIVPAAGDRLINLHGIGRYGSMALMAVSPSVRMAVRKH
jgi:hypothetical protein